MPDTPPPTRRKFFTYALLTVRLPPLRPRTPGPLLPEWICLHPIEHEAVVRTVKPINIRAPLAEFDEDEKILEFGGNFCAG